MSNQPSVRRPTCPDPLTLQMFLNDGLPPENARRVDAHGSSCPTCQQALERLVGGVPSPLAATANEGGQTADEMAPKLLGYETVGRFGSGA